MARRIADESKSVGQIQQVGEVRGGEVCIVVIERTTFPVAHVPKDCGFP